MWKAPPGNCIYTVTLLLCYVNTFFFPRSLHLYRSFLVFSMRYIVRKILFKKKRLEYAKLWDVDISEYYQDQQLPMGTPKFYVEVQLGKNYGWEW